MRQTLFTIPHEVYGLPVFGFGWVLLLWALGGVVAMFVTARRQGWNDDTKSLLYFLIAVGAVIAFGLPMVEAAQSGPADQGLPIRGYGVMLLLAVVTGVGLAAWRAQRMGVDPEAIYSLAFWMFVFGIVGARLFHVIEYWEHFQRPTWTETFLAAINVTQGGLVVYGSVIGGVAAGAVFLYRRGMPVLATADLVAPSMVIGLAIGRVGCFLNGCCFGGVCELPWAVRFPPQSPPYYRQHQLGQLHGFRIVEDKQGRPVVGYVDPEGTAQQAGLREGDAIRSIQLSPAAALQAAAAVPAFAGEDLIVRKAGGEELRLTLPRWRGADADAAERRLGLRVFDLGDGPAVVEEVIAGEAADRAGLRAGDRIAEVRLPATPTASIAQDVMPWTGDELRIETERGEIALRQESLPARSLPIHPTQIYAAINAALIFFFLWVYYPFRARDGEVFALLMTIYPVTRYLEEVIRTDEPPQFGTGLSISQLVSVGVLILVVALWAYILRRPRGSVWPVEHASAEPSLHQ